MRKKRDVYSISEVGNSLTNDQQARSRRYLISMTFRVVTFGLAVIVDGWLRWVLLSASLVLPWIAVVVANAGKENGRRFAAQYETGRELE